MSTHISEDQKERERKRTEAIAAKEQAREKREQARKGGKGGNGKSLKDDMAAKKEAELREKKDARANRIKETEGKRAAKQAEADAAAPTQSAKCARPHAQTLAQPAEAPRRAVWPKAPARAPARRPMRRGGACRYSKKEIMILYELFSECASARLPLRAPAPPDQLQTSCRPDPVRSPPARLRPSAGTTWTARARSRLQSCGASVSPVRTGSCSPTRPRRLSAPLRRARHPLTRQRSRATACG